MPLESHYVGDNAFAAMANLLRSEWVDDEFTERLLEALKGDEQLAVVIFGTMRSDALAWIERSIPALEGATPLECLRTENGRNRLKECLLRFPR